MWRAVIGILLFAAVSCSVPLPGKATPVASPSSTAVPEQQGQRCADILMKAIFGIETVPGTYDCLSPDQQALAANSGLKTDADFAGFAVLDGFTSMTYVGYVDGAFIYELDGPTGKAMEIVWTDADGKVSQLGYLRSSL